jgi:hypothetical protein
VKTPPPNCSGAAVPAPGTPSIATAVTSSASRRDPIVETVLAATHGTLRNPNSFFTASVAEIVGANDLWAILAVAAVVVVANVPLLAGVSEPNPFGPRSGLVAASSPGPLPGEPSIDPNDGFISQALGHRAALDLLHLHLPWWDPYEGTGAPLAAGMTSAALFPPTLLNAFSNGLVFERVLLEVAAGVLLYLLLRRLSLARAACVAAAVAFALDGTFAWFAITPINAIPLLPALLLGLELAYARSVAGVRGGWWLIAVAGALSFYAGFPEVAYLDGLLAVGWFAWRASLLRGTSLRAFAAKAGAGAGAGVLLSAPLLVPFTEYLGRGALGSHADGVSGRVHLATPALSQLLLPYVYGPILAFGDTKLTLTTIWFDVGGFLSTSLLFFGVLGLSGAGPRGLRFVCAGWIVLALARIYHEPRLLGDVLGVLPGMSRVAFFRYAFPAVELAFVVLAALGLDGLARAGPSRRRLSVAAAASLALVAAAALEARPLAHRLGSGFYDHPYFWGSVGWGAAVVLAGTAVALLARSTARVGLAGLLVVVDAVVLFALPEASAPRHVRLDLAPARYLQQRLGDQRLFTLGPLQPNYGSYFALSQLNINELPVPQTFADYVHRRLDQVVDPTVLVGNLGGGRPTDAPSPVQELLRNLDGYRAAGVAYVLAPAGQALPRPAFTLALRSPTTWLYRLNGAAPYLDAPGCTVAAASRTAAAVTCPAPTQLVRRETDYPGWSARVDGRSVAIRRVDGVFQAITVPAGSHRVTFGYAPSRIDWAYAAFGLGCAWLLLGLRSRPLRPLRRLA